MYRLQGLVCYGGLLVSIGFWSQNYLTSLAAHIPELAGWNHNMGYSEGVRADSRGSNDLARLNHIVRFDLRLDSPSDRGQILGERHVFCHTILAIFKLPKLQDFSLIVPWRFEIDELYLDDWWPWLQSLTANNNHLKFSVVTPCNPSWTREARLEDYGDRQAMNAVLLQEKGLQVLKANVTHKGIYEVERE